MLVNGDINFGNVLFSHSDPSRVLAFIDFQTTSYGNIALDLERVIYSVINKLANVRHKNSLNSNVNSILYLIKRTFMCSINAYII